jgi:hypothetical protein
VSTSVLLRLVSMSVWRWWALTSGVGSPAGAAAAAGRSTLGSMAPNPMPIKVGLTTASSSSHSRAATASWYRHALMAPRLSPYLRRDGVVSARASCSCSRGVVGVPPRLALEPSGDLQRLRHDAGRPAAHRLAHDALPLQVLPAVPGAELEGGGGGQ